MSSARARRRTPAAHQLRDVVGQYLLGTDNQIDGKRIGFEDALVFLLVEILEMMQSTAGEKRFVGAAGIFPLHGFVEERLQRQCLFRAQGFQLAGGDKWAEKPELTLYSGGVNRLAIEKLLRQFADREGINLTTVFNGCGILCATMKTMGDAKAAKFPDAYYACDLCFVPPVAEQFPEAVMLTETDIGIAVRKGNPHGVRTLADLALPGLKVGLCNAEQSTLGFMTRGMLKQTGLLESVRKNVVVEVPTADFLINQMRAGGLDARQEDVVRAPGEFRLRGAFPNTESDNAALFGQEQNGGIVR